MAYGNQKRKHGNVWYAGKYAARGLGAYGAYVSHLGSSKWGWKKGGKVFKRLLGGIGGPRRRLGSNQRVYRPATTGSNRGHRLGSNTGKKTGYNGRLAVNYHPGRKAFKRSYNK